MKLEISRNIDTIYILVNDGKYRCFTSLERKREEENNYEEETKKNLIKSMLKKNIYKENIYEIITYIVSEEEIQLIYNSLKDDSKNSITINGRDSRNDKEFGATYILYKDSIKFIECVNLIKVLEHLKKNIK